MTYQLKAIGKVKMMKRHIYSVRAGVHSPDYEP